MQNTNACKLYFDHLFLFQRIKDDRQYFQFLLYIEIIARNE